MCLHEFHDKVWHFFICYIFASFTEIMFEKVLGRGAFFPEIMVNIMKLNETN